MKLSNIGEFGLIEEYIAPGFKDLVKKHLTGIGDDCSIIPINDTTSHIFTTDMLIENTHFLREKISPFQLGFKSLAVNLSDIAAMGGTPIGSYISIGLPKDIELEWVKQFMVGYKKLSQQENVPLLGGDTTSSEKPIIINVGITGEMKTEKIKKRSAAESGDIICLTGETGDSAGGLQALFLDLETDERYQPLVHQHLSPYPHVAQGKWLANYPEVHAMMDVSDGINSDLPHILKASHKKATIFLDKLPISNTLLTFCKDQDIHSEELATSGGEDYVLLLTIQKEAFNKIADKFMDQFQTPLYPIGEIGPGEPEIIYYRNNQKIQSQKKGFSHF